MWLSYQMLQPKFCCTLKLFLTVTDLQLLHIVYRLPRVTYFYHTSRSGEDDILIWKFSSRGRSMMQQKLDFLSAPDYSHGHRDWSNQETSINNICCNASGTLVCASRGSLLNIWSVSGGQAHVDSSQSHVMCATWPMVSESTLKQVRSKDALLIGRLDGSVAVIDVKDCMHYNRVEIEFCKREGRVSSITNDIEGY